MREISESGRKLPRGASNHPHRIGGWGTVAASIWTLTRCFLGSCKRQTLLERPRGLQALGKRTTVKRPRKLIGRKAIRIGNETYILSNSFMLAVSKYADKTYQPMIEIGDGVYIGRHVYLTSMQGISIGDGCVLSEHVYITDLNHGYNPERGPILSQDLETKGPVRIGANCFLGYRCVVMSGVTLGDWCIVGANAVVTRSFPSYSMIGGVPARLIKFYSHDLHDWIFPAKIENGEES